MSLKQVTDILGQLTAHYHKCISTANGWIDSKEQLIMDAEMQ